MYRRLALLVPCLSACFSPSEPDEAGANGGTTQDTDSGTSATTPTSESSPTATTNGPGTTASTTATSTTAPSTATDSSSSSSSTTESNADSSSSSSTGAPAECGNGIAEPGEFCITETTALEVNCPPNLLASGDIDGNSRLDLLYAAVSDAEIHIFLGDGGGGFVGGPAEALSPQTITLGNFNDDDDLDIAYLDSSAELNVILNDGNGSLPGANMGTAVIGNTATAAGDLDNNGFDDVISVGPGSSIGVALFDSNGSGGFMPTTVGQIGGNGIRNDVVVADFNGNDNLDFAFSDTLGDGRVTACLGDGNGGSSSCNSFPAGDLPMGLAAGDFDGDGNTDLVTADVLSDTVTLLRGQGNGGFETGVALIVGDGPRYVALADLDLDGYDDLVVSHGTDFSIHVLRFDPTQDEFGAAVVFQSEGAAPTNITAADFNEDGAVDLAVGNATESVITLLISDA